MRRPWPRLRFVIAGLLCLASTSNYLDRQALCRRAAAEWFPMRERALAIGIFNAGTALGSTLAVPVVSAVALLAGWRWAFAIVGASGFLWVAAWAGCPSPSTPSAWSPRERSRARSSPAACPSIVPDLGRLRNVPEGVRS